MEQGEDLFVSQKKKKPAFRHACEGVTCTVSQVSEEFANLAARQSAPALALQTLLGPKNSSFPLFSSVSTSRRGN